MATQTAKPHQQDYPQWFEYLARLGYIVKGIVYAIVGVLATQVAFGTGGETTGTKGALQEIVSQPFGTVLLSIVAFGLMGYALWRLVQAAFDPEHKGNDAEGIGARIGYAISGVIYGFLAFTALQIVLGTGGGGGSSTDSRTAWLMSQPFGIWLVGIVGVAIIGVGLYQLYRGITADFRKQINEAKMNDREETVVTTTGRIGLSARGVVLGLIGIFVIQAAWQADPNEAAGLGQSLAELAQQPFGPWLLGLVALGLIAYGVFMIMMGRYRHINVPDPR
jgi:hypothetical protein